MGQMSVQEYESKEKFLRVPFVVDTDELTSLTTFFQLGP